MVGNGFLFHAEQVVWRDVESLAKVDDLLIIELNSSRFIIAVIGLIFIELFCELRLREPHCLARGFEIGSDAFGYRFV